MKKKKSNEMDYTDGILSPDGILFTNYTAMEEQKQSVSNTFEMENTK